MKGALTLRQFELLAAVRRGGSLAEIGKRLGVTRVTVYTRLTRLAAAGYLRLEPRSLTVKGEKALNGAIGTIKAALSAAEAA